MSLRYAAIAGCIWASSCGDGDPSAAVAPDTTDAAVEDTCFEGLALSDPDDCKKVAALLLPEKLPEARGNAFGDSLAAAELGFQVFYDPRFSTVEEMRCATCHIPEKYFGDGLKVSLGKDDKPLLRNSPSIFASAWTPGDFFWDGRADSLWSQPLFAFENPDEMATTRLSIAHTIVGNEDYRALYTEAFAELPDLSDLERFPLQGKPGDKAFDAMREEDKDTVNRMVANVGKALEAYMRKVATGRAPLDAFLLGDASLFNEGAARGLTTFAKAGCIDCHGGPVLSDGLYHDMKVPPLPGAPKDRGRADGIAILEDNPFNAEGPYYDAKVGKPAPRPSKESNLEGAFRTPSLRDVMRTGPYGHNGYYTKLEELLKAHGPTKLSEAEISDLIAFFLQLNGREPERPWSNWPTN